MYFKANKLDRKNYKYEPPPSGWSKLNFDGALRGSFDKGVCLSKRVKPLGLISNNLSELEALVEGLIICQDLGINKLIIEGNSQIILNALRKRETPNWILNSKLEYALAIFDHLRKTLLNIHIGKVIKKQMI